jgi:hypothetical protein
MQLMHLREAHGVQDPLLEPVEVPHAATWIYRTFWKLSDRQRQYAEMSGMPKLLSYSDMNDYATIKRVEFSQFEIEALEAMDVAFVSAALRIKRGA